MPSKLLRSAFKSLPTAGRRTLVRLGSWLRSYRAAVENPPDGKKILKNLLCEAHLVGDAAFDDATELSAFLQCCVERFSGELKPAEYHPCYEEACARFEGRGLRVRPEHLPDRFLRYSTSVRQLKLLAEEMVAETARVYIETDIKENPEALFEMLRKKWDPSKIKETKLGRSTKEIVFATFEYDHTDAPRLSREDAKPRSLATFGREHSSTPKLNREDAMAVSKALALSFWEPRRTGEAILFEFSYPRDAVEDPRFPTVADAVWVSSFHPAEELAPDPGDPRTWWGWTRPFGPHPPQPEIVHKNASFSVVKDKPRWVGRISR